MQWANRVYLLYFVSSRSRKQLRDEETASFIDVQNSLTVMYIEGFT